MRSKLTVVNADDIEMELSITMPLKQWRVIKGQLNDDHPSWEIGAKITDMIFQAERHFSPKENN